MENFLTYTFTVQCSLSLRPSAAGKNGREKLMKILLSEGMKGSISLLLEIVESIRLGARRYTSKPSWWGDA